jgi:hypothetical protein
VSTTQLHKLRSLLSVILGGIETNNREVSLQAIKRMDAELRACACANSVPEDRQS